MNHYRKKSPLEKFTAAQVEGVEPPMPTTLEAMQNSGIARRHNHRNNEGMGERAPWARRRTEAEQRRMDAQLLYALEMEFRKIGWGTPAYVYDDEKDLFRFHDGRFAFSRKHADWALLRTTGRIRRW